MQVVAHFYKSCSMGNHLRYFSGQYLLTTHLARWSLQNENFPLRPSQENLQASWSVNKILMTRLGQEATPDPPASASCWT